MWINIGAVITAIIFTPLENILFAKIHIKTVKHVSLCC